MAIDFTTLIRCVTSTMSPGDVVDSTLNYKQGKADSSPVQGIKTIFLNECVER